MTREFFVTTAREMEPLLARELGSLGISRFEVSRAGGAFLGTLEDAYRVCLWSRIANRVLLPLKAFHAPTPERLYGGVKSIRWSDHLGPDNTLAVDFSAASAGGSGITHTHYAALKVKDAIVDQLRSTQGARPSIDTFRPDVRVNVYLTRDQATVSIDLSGESLHRRGYREEGAEAPLKENLAAAILMHTGWPERLAQAREDGTALPSFIDPMCGSGTLPIEAALMAADIAPGLERKHFGFLRWRGHDSVAWQKLVNEAQDREIQDRRQLPRIVGYDQDFRAVRVALANVERAGLTGRVHIEKRELSECEPIASGILVANPPYGERLGEEEQLVSLYTQLGDTLKRRFTGWDGYVFTGSPMLAKEVGLRPARRHVLFNGPIECRLFKYELYAGRAQILEQSEG